MTNPGRNLIVQQLALPILLSLVMGLLVTYGALLASHHPLWQPALDFGIARNLLWPVSAVLLLAAVAVTVNYRALLFAQRYRIAIALMIVAPALSGLNIVRLDPPDIAIMLVTLFWMASVMVEDRPVMIPRVLIAMMLCLVWLVVGGIMTNGAHVFLSLPSVITKLMVVFLLANLISTARDHDLALKMLVTVAAVSAFVAIVVFALYMLTGFALTFDDRPDEHFKCYGWICLFRATAFTPTPQVLGHLLVMGISLSLFVPLRNWHRVALVLVILLGAVLTLSVGVILAVGAVLALFPIFRWPALYAHILTGYAVTILLAHATGLWAWIYQTANNLLLADLGVNIRVWTYRGGIELLEKSPAFGIGALKQIPGSMHFSTPHNTYLQVALEMGIPAWLLFLGLLSYLYFSCWKITARAKDAAVRLRMRGLLLGFTGMLIHFISEPMFPNNLPWTFFGLLTAGIIVYGRTHTDPQWSAVCQARPRVQRLARDLRNTGFR